MSISVQGVSKAFPLPGGARAPVLDDVDLEVSDGCIVGLFGPNGSGKTTLLNIIGGLEQPDAGSVQLGALPPGRTRLGYAFQDYRHTLLPWKSARGNVAFALRAAGVPAREASARAAAFMARNGLSLPDSYSYQLSGGQQQIAALARVLIQEPANVLFDEPFSALDHNARYRMQDAVFAMLRPDAATLLVSHDIDEALYLCDELLILRGRPARVAQRFKIPFARPRSDRVRVSREFTELRREVLAAYL